MFRAILYFIVAIVVASVLRAILGMIGNLFGGITTSSATPRSSGPAPSSAPESLHKDPVCGTFVAPSTAWQKASGGKTYYFCSTHCRDQFKG